MEQHGNEYRVNLEVFEGPLDLLLYLIRKNDLDVYDIPITFILEEYMRYLDTLKELDIDVAGEFLLMAADLMHIKSRLLLPQDEVASAEEEEGDPRAELVRRLLEYQRYREAAAELNRRTILGRDVFVPLAPERLPERTDGPIEGTVYDLIEAFGRVLARIPADRFHAVAVDRVSVNDRILALVDRIPKGATIRIDDLLVEPITRYEVVITFLALLEMCRLKMVSLYQVERCGEMYITGCLDHVEGADVLKYVKADGVGVTTVEEGTHGTT
ncbi:MAG: segregation/condensation protein A [Deltaproteobacteria bacterium]|nr:segregation/condensation protein A [Deltaproteobacteria bacterium]